MLQESENSINKARNRDATRAEIIKAQAAIEREIGRVFFAPLLCVVSDYLKKPVVLKAFSSEAVPKNISDVDNDLDAELEADEELKGAAADVIEAVRQLASTVKSRSNTLDPAQAIRFIRTEEASGQIVIWVESLEEDWLRSKYQPKSKISKADVLHIAIAHEAMGLLFAMDSRKAETPDEQTIEREEETHELGIRHFVRHVMDIKQYHEIPLFYARNRHDLFMAFGFALQRINRKPGKSFKQTLDQLIDASEKKGVKRLRVCPVAWGTQCPNGLTARESCPNATKCTHSAAFQA